MKKTLTIGICGVQGYAGQELLKVLKAHPHVAKIMGFSHQSNCEYKPFYPLSDLEHYSSDIDVLFLATPALASIDIALKIKDKIKIIIDLSGAFRLEKEDYEQWYQQEHSAPELIDDAVYGLMPWCSKHIGQREMIFIANPGCYATAALMSLLPLLKTDVIKSQNIIIDGKSGVSGAGRKPSMNLHFCEMANNFYPYKIGNHQHTPEISKIIFDYTGTQSSPILSTYLLPIERGLMTTIYAELSDGFTRVNNMYNRIDQVFASFYQDYSLIEWAPFNENAYCQTIKSVVGKPNIYLQYSISDNKIIMFTTIDNLMKGAATQAIENMNVCLSLKGTTGLENRGVMS